jgi:hypothetical protein
LGATKKLVFLQFSLLRGKYPDYLTFLFLLVAGADPGFVGLEAFSVLGDLFKKKNTKLRIQNEVRKIIFI